MGEAPDVAYQDVLDEVDSTWVVKGLKVTQGNLVPMWKVRPQIEINSRLPLGLRMFTRGGGKFSSILTVDFPIRAKKKKKNLTLETIIFTIHNC